ncbi:hypothetical protein [Spirosoma spitsbergense]|uniref:hypothetical protein n=1 Tax=Spirosoma spitsbergense TaxID=431554 RepID=UPI00037839E6|nr:hypothetical protein [Spirosoma spitsbergense]
MKIKSLILAFPVLCLACNNPSTPQDPASQMDASPIVAKRVAGVNMLTTDFNYDQPCTILGEEYVRGAFNLEETTKLSEGYGHDGCEFAWEGGNKVIISFVGDRPFSSVFTAEYMFDKMYQGKQPVAVVSPEVDTQEVQTATSEEGATPNATAVQKLDTSNPETTATMPDNQPQHGGVTAASPALTAPSIGYGTGKAVRDLGDKAVWDEAKGAMHVLYNNNIINVTVSTKGKPEMREEQAKSLAEVLIEKIAENEYTKAL